MLHGGGMPGVEDAHERCEYGCLDLRGFVCAVISGKVFISAGNIIP